jgi:hypothetical protein
MDRGFEVVFISDRGWKGADGIEMIRTIREEFGARIEFHLYRPHLTYEITEFDEVGTITKNREQGRFSIWLGSAADGTACCLDIPSPLLEDSGREVRFRCGAYAPLFDWSRDEGGRNMRRMLGVFRKVNAALRPFHGLLASGNDPNNFFLSARRPSTSEYGREYEFLLNEVNLFGPEIVDRIGAGRLKALKAHVAEELEGGGMLVVPVALNHPDFERRHVGSGDFRLPLDKKTVEWYSKATGLKSEPRPRRLFW